VIPSGFAGVEQQLLLWALAMVRPGAAFLAAPVFGAPQVPVQLRLVLALAIGIPAAQLSGLQLPEAGLVSVQGVAMIMSEVLTGLALGFAVQIGFAAAVLAGEVIGNAMGIGFASMTNPMSGASSPAVGQFLMLLATFLFLATDGHLILARIVVESYDAIKPGQDWLSAEAIGGLAKFGGLVFAAGVAIALPVAFALILVQIVMGMIARSAPALNLFAVGLPATLLAGIVLMAMATPVLSEAILAALNEALAMSGMLARG
jgi:flagellar biosynthesis protein FliR